LVAIGIGERLGREPRPLSDENPACEPGNTGRDYFSGKGIRMNRNVIMLVVVVLAVAVAVLGYQLYQERHKSGVEISVGNHGISIEKK
jgi:hypothetical protein